jgi:lipopolysaccharide transport system ATP-binding protein
MERAITLTGVSKMYKLYRRRSARLRDFLGWMPVRPGRDFAEFWALRDISLEIDRGTTLGVVGRNGAGKSTLLRLLAGTASPTAGTIACAGRISALLELGTGFHPDLTGRENIYAGGLYLGLDRRTMDDLHDEIAAFADLREFLDQPVRTYSSGMYLRLAFAVATCLPADIQLIDEVLGVGDLNFFAKCMARFRELQAQGRTSVLVSHDHATLLRLCTRCIWIEEGRVVADGTPLEVITAYNESLYQERDREAERALSGDADRARTLRRDGAVRLESVQFLRADGRPAQSFSTGEALTVRMSYRASVALAQPVIAVTIYRADGVVACNSISSMDDAGLDLTEGCGAVDLCFDPLLLGPGDYTVVIGVYPSLYLDDTTGVQHAVLWHAPQTFSVRKPAGVALDMGLFRHPARWRQHSGQPVSLPDFR